VLAARRLENLIDSKNGAAYTLHAEDDDFGQANTMINKVFSKEQRAPLVETVSGTMAGIQREEILQRAFQSRRNIDKAIGDKIEAATNEKRSVGASERLCSKQSIRASVLLVRF